VSLQGFIPGLAGLNSPRVTGTAAGAGDRREFSILVSLWGTDDPDLTMSVTRPSGGGGSEGDDHNSSMFGKNWTICWQPHGPRVRSRAR